jgi:SWI/SNF related-matrix-associated actin-dependent regulator of chromatin subfamily C
MFSGDFVKLTAVQSASAHSSGGTDDWTDQEVLLLLEGVEMYDDDWSLIEEHVGTRSAQQCIRKFLELPIEDPYLDAESEGAKGPLRYARLPFEQADNPVMSVVAFLAGVVGPGVAAEAAKTAMKELTNGNAVEEGGEKEGEQKEGEKEAEKDDQDMVDAEKEKSGEATENGDAKKDVSADDAMNVDSSPTSATTSKKSNHTIPHSKVARAAHIALSASTRAAQQLADAEETSIRSALSELIKLTLSKLELKMAQFEEMEELLEEERRNLESQRMALAAERMSLRKAVETVRAEVAKNNAASAGASGSVTPAMSMMSGGAGGVGAAVNAAATVLSAGQGPKVSEVAGKNLSGDAGPSTDGSFAPIG